MNDHAPRQPDAHELMQMLVRIEAQGVRSNNAAESFQKNILPKVLAQHAVLTALVKTHPQPDRLMAQFRHEVDTLSEAWSEASSIPGYGPASKELAEEVSLFEYILNRRPR